MLSWYGRNSITHLVRGLGERLGSLDEIAVMQYVRELGTVLEQEEPIRDVHITPGVHGEWLLVFHERAAVAALHRVGLTSSELADGRWRLRQIIHCHMEHFHA